MTSQSIAIRHSVEMAHRLYHTPGRCQQIHGHNWRVELTLFGPVNRDGLLAGLNFSIIKPEFRKYLDDTFDHRILLNERDPWAGFLRTELNAEGDAGTPLPGLQTLSVDPTTENFARIIGETVIERFHLPAVSEMRVRVDETDTNTAEWRRVLV